MRRTKKKRGKTPAIFREIGGKGRTKGEFLIGAERGREKQRREHSDGVHNICPPGKGNVEARLRVRRGRDKGGFFREQQEETKGKKRPLPA